MDRVSGALTVFFEDPFWVGVFERISGERLAVCKVTFGSSPKDNEVYAFILKHYRGLRFSPAVAAAVKETAHNPKRGRRQVSRQAGNTGIGTKSQQALQLQQEQNKQVRKRRSRARKQADAKRLYALKQQQKREKHKGH